jgi:hypothetical protein
MLKTIRITGLIIFLAGTLSSCAITFPVNATSNPIGPKVGSAKAVGYLGVIFINQDASIQAAARNGGITRISTVDIKHTNILNLVVTYETIVTGE